jgi:hypothetical protein
VSIIGNPCSSSGKYFPALGYILRAENMGHLNMAFYSELNSRKAK